MKNTTTIEFKVYENTCNDINTLTLTGIHSLKTAQIAKRVHYRTTGRVQCYVGSEDKQLEVDEFPSFVLRYANQFKADCLALERLNIEADMIGREIFAVVAHHSFCD